MIDSTTFKCINFNYFMFTFKLEDKNILNDLKFNDNNAFKDNFDEEGEIYTIQFNDERKKRKLKKKLIKDEKIEVYYYVEISIDEEENVIQKKNIEKFSNQNNFDKREFIDEKYLIAISIALRFNFKEKF